MPFNIARKHSVPRDEELFVCGYRGDGGRGFYNLGTQADWWSSSVSGTGAWYRELNTSYTSVKRNVEPRSYGFSVRCVRNLCYV